MIQTLGIKRIMILVFLFAINVAFAAGLYLYIYPEAQKKDRELKRLRGQISSVQGDIAKLQVEFDQLADQREEFEVLKQKGFFSSQGRREAEEIFKRIQDQSQVISAVASIRRGELEENEEAGKASHKVLVSPIDVKIEAIDDIDVFRYIYLVQRFFPGHISIDQIRISRGAEVTGTVLRSIASGSKPNLVQADIQMSWRTLIPETDIIVPDSGGRR